jgi:hypothetical protein
MLLKNEVNGASNYQDYLFSSVFGDKSDFVRPVSNAVVTPLEDDDDDWDDLDEDDDWDDDYDDYDDDDDDEDDWDDWGDDDDDDDESW